MCVCVCACVRACVRACVCVCVCENQPCAIMKVTYVRGWTSPVCDVMLPVLRNIHTVI